jgi:hypothetical protein
MNTSATSADHHRMLILLVAACLVLTLGSGLAAAGPRPTDGAAGADSAPVNILDILLTDIFALGEVDLSTLGVNAADLGTVGPQADLTGERRRHAHRG